MESGARLANGHTRHLMWLDGMHCGGCSIAIEHALKMDPNIFDAKVNFMESYVVVDAQSRINMPETIERICKKLGYNAYSADVSTRLTKAKKRIQIDMWLLIAACLFSMWSMLSALVTYLDFSALLPPVHVASLLFVSGITSIPVLLLAYKIHQMALFSLERGQSSIDLLVSAGAIGAFTVSAWQLFVGGDMIYFDTACMLLLLHMTGRFIEQRRRVSTLEQLKKMDSFMQTKQKRITPLGDFDFVLPKQVKAGDTLIINKGDILLHDGILKSSNATVEISMLSGESKPIDKNPNDELYAGTRNLGTPIKVVVKKPLGNTTADIQMLEVLTNRVKQSQSQQFINQLSRYVSNGILGLAVLNASIMVIFLDPLTVFERTLAIMIIACPCSLTVAIPLASSLLQQIAAKKHITVNNTWALYEAANARDVYFDKTGTITQPDLSLVQTEVYAPFNKNHVDYYASILSFFSSHVYCVIIQQTYVSKPTKLDTLSTVDEVVGKGVQWYDLAKDIEVLLGSAAWLKSKGVVGHFITNKTGTYLAIDGMLAAFFYIDNKVCSQAKSLVTTLNLSGLRSYIMSGDSWQNCQKVANKISISHFYSLASPTKKARLLERSARPSIFIGDGMNDNLALATANLGITFEHVCALTQSSADIIIKRDSLCLIPYILKLSRTFKATIRRNLMFALFYNVCAIPLAIFGVVSPLVAIIAMLLSSLSILLNTYMSLNRVSFHLTQALDGKLSTQVKLDTERGDHA